MKPSSEEYLLFIVKGLVEHQDDIQITKTQDEMGTLLSLRVNQQDMGNIIGREGKGAESIRTILRNFGMKDNRTRLTLKILEPNEKDVSNFRLNRGVMSDHTA